MRQNISETSIKHHLRLTDKNASEVLDIERLQQQQNKRIQELLKQQQQQTLALTLPQPEVPVFSGDPTEDSDFIRPLESDPSMKLYYLVQYTPSDVRQLMHGRYSRIVTARVIRLLLLTLNVLPRYGLWHSRFRSNKG